MVHVQGIFYNKGEASGSLFPPRITCSKFFNYLLPLPLLHQPIEHLAKTRVHTCFLQDSENYPKATSSNIITVNPNMAPPVARWILPAR